MGDGSRISFWKDNWVGGRTIISVVGRNFMRKTSMNPDISVREFYSHPTWVNFIEGKEDREVRKLRPSLLRLLNLIPQQVVFIADSVDSLIWKPSHSGTFSIKSAWEVIRARFARVYWSSLVWYKGVIPRLSLLLWMVILNRLPNKDRLSRMGLAQDLLCLLCKTELKQLRTFFSLAGTPRRFGS